MSQQSLEKMKKTVKPLMKKNHIRSNKMQGSTAYSDEDRFEKIKTKWKSTKIKIIREKMTDM